jgi:hypothetical protein
MRMLVMTPVVRPGHIPRRSGMLSGTQIRYPSDEPARFRCCGLWGCGELALIGANVAATVLEPIPADPNLPQPWFVALPSIMVAFGILAARHQHRGSTAPAKPRRSAARSMWGRSYPSCLRM